MEVRQNDDIGSIAMQQLDRVALLAIDRTGMGLDLKWDTLLVFQQAESSRLVSLRLPISARKCIINQKSSPFRFLLLLMRVRDRVLPMQRIDFNHLPITIAIDSC